MSHAGSRHSALVSMKLAAKSKERIAISDQQFRNHVQNASKDLKLSTQASLRRIMEAGSMKFQRKKTYHSSPFSSYDEDSCIEAAPLSNVTSKLAVDLFHPRPKMLATLEPIESYMCRGKDASDELVIDFDRKEREEIRIKREKEFYGTMNAVQKGQRERELSNDVRRSSVMTFDSAADHVDHKNIDHTATTNYVGVFARDKFFYDLKSFNKSDHDHMIHDTRDELKRLKKKQKQQDKNSLLKLNASERRKYFEVEDKEEDKEKDKEKDKVIPKKKRVKFAASTTGESLDRWQEKRRRAHEAMTTSKTINDLHESNFQDYSQRSAQNRNETVHLSYRHRMSLEHETAASIDRVEFRSIDPRHTYMKECMRNDFLPEPLLISTDRVPPVAGIGRISHSDLLAAAGGSSAGASAAAAGAAAAAAAAAANVVSGEDPGENFASPLQATKRKKKKDKEEEITRRQTLNLAHYKLGDERIIALAPSLASMGMYKTILLSDNRATDVALHFLLHSIVKEIDCHNTIATLDLSENEMGPRTIDRMPMFIQSQSSSLLSLHLGGTLKKLNELQRMKLIQCLTNGESQTLVELRLPSNGLTNKEAACLAESLSTNKCPQLRSLDLEWNSLTEIGVRAIAESLSTNTTLKELNLNFNSAGKAAASFARSLLVNKTLKALLLEANLVNGRGAIVFSEYLLETEHPLEILNLNSNPITTMGARAMIRVLSRGVAMKRLSFKTEYAKDKKLRDQFSPLYLPKEMILDLSVPFQRAQATMLMRMAAEDAGFDLLRLRYDNSDLELTRQCLDLEGSSIKNYKKHFMRLCRRNNPHTFFTSIEKAFIPTWQARELLMVAHNGTVPCDLMYSIIVSCFDVNDDGIIEWEEFYEGMMIARKMFGPTVRRMGQKPIGVMVLKGSHPKHKFVMPTDGLLEINYQVAKVPLLSHNEITRVNFTKILQVLELFTTQTRLALISLLVQDAALSSSHAIQLCKILERHPGSAELGLTLDNIVEVLLAVTNKKEMCQILKSLNSTTKVMLRKHMRGNYRCLLGIYTGAYSIDLSFKTDRAVMQQIIAHYNLLVMNGLGGAAAAATAATAAADTLADTSQNQDWIHMSNVSLDSAPFSLSPYLLSPTSSLNGEYEEIQPLPDKGTLRFNLVEIQGPNPASKILSRQEFVNFLHSLSLESISGIMLCHEQNNNNNNVVVVDEQSEALAQSSSSSSSNSNSSKEESKESKETTSILLLPKKCRLATQVEIVMATKIENAARTRIARNIVASKRKERTSSNVLLNFKSNKERVIIHLQRFFRKQMLNKQQSAADNGSLYAPKVPFPPPFGNTTKEEKFRKYLWPMNPSVRREGKEMGGREMGREEDNKFWKWCATTVGGPHNTRVGVYNIKEPYFHLSTVHGRSSLDNKLNHVLEGVSEISLTCMQLRSLLFELPAGVVGVRTECAIGCFSSLVDPAQFECVVMSMLTSRERDEIIYRLGCLNVWTPIWCDRHYVLNLALPDQKIMAENLIALGSIEKGEKHHFKEAWYDVGAMGDPKDKPGFSFSADSNFAGGIPPDHGIFSFRYGVQADGPSMEQRHSFMSKCYSGRCQQRRNHYIKEIQCVTKIQAYMRRTAIRIKYARANWCIQIVDFATPKARKAATTLQGLVRGYRLRKFLTKMKMRRRKFKKNGFSLKDALQQEDQKKINSLQNRSGGKRHLSPKEKMRRRSCFMMNITGVEKLDVGAVPISVGDSRRGNRKNLRKTM